MRPRFIDFKYIGKALDETFATLKTPSIFNTGELSDSLMNPALMEKIVDKFEEQDSASSFLTFKVWSKKRWIPSKETEEAGNLRLEHQRDWGR